jgi:hypothetical protein
MSAFGELALVVRFHPYQSKADLQISLLNGGNVP